MDWKTFVIEILKQLISPTASIILLFVSLRTSKKTSKTEKLSSRLTGGYLPFILEYNRNVVWETRFSELTVPAQKKFYDILLKDYHFLESNSKYELAYFFQAYSTYRKILPFNDCTKEAKELDVAFNNLTKNIFEKYRKISKTIGRAESPTPPLPSTLSPEIEEE